MTETIELSRTHLKNILRMYVDATELLEKIPKKQDQGRFSEISQEIGAELEARVRMMNEAEKEDHIVRELLEEISNNQVNDSSLEKLEDDVLED